MSKTTIETSDDEMQESAEEFAAAIIGHKIVKVEKDVTIPNTKSYWRNKGTALTLDDGQMVFLIDTGDCCAHTELEKFLFAEELADNIITSVGTTDNFMTWHILADLNEVLKLDVSWSEGSGYYSYGFDIEVYKPGQYENEWLQIVNQA